MNEASLQTEALERYLSLDWGLVGLTEVKAWADARILTEQNPECHLHDISLAGNINDVFSGLEALSKGGDSSLALKSVFKRVLSIGEMTPVRASELARKILHLTIDDNVPKEVYPLVHHWDEIELALDGTLGDPASATEAFLSDLSALSR